MAAASIPDSAADPVPPRPQSAHAEFRSRRDFGSLDGLRAACILAVIWHHSGPGFAWLPGSQRGFLGVDMFFVISGFLIVTLLLRERRRTDAISLRNFYARRTLRIFPAYYGVLLTLTAVYLLRDSARATLFWAELPAYLTYTSNWVPVAIFPLAWSLAAEEQFYLCWPPIEKWLRGAAVPLMLVFVVGNQLVNFGVGIGAPETWFGRHFLELAILQATFTPICLGVLLAHALHDERGFAVLGRFLGLPVAAAALAVVLLAVCNVPSKDIRGLQRLSIQVLMTGTIGACVVSESNGLRRILAQRPLVRIGVVSYGMYLYHNFVIPTVDARLPGDSDLVVFAVSAVATWLVAELSFRGFEVRFLEWKKRFASAPSQASPRSG